MKQIFRCEYCNETGTAEEMEKHEDACIHNRTKRSCLTCKHATTKSMQKYECALNRDIPEGQYFQQCPQYEWDEKDWASRSWNNVFGNLFGGI